MVEILAPAGNIECAKAAIDSGANAIYLGYSVFSARQNADNFDEKGLRGVLENAHIHGVKVYVAMNTLVKESELDDFLQTLLSVWNTGVDAVILQDALLGRTVHELYPQIVLHLSTQAGCCNLSGANFAKESGFSRVILARETPIETIREIAAYIETEVFVQGALCTCFSGQCYFSSFAGGNSGNRGRCKQPCRKKYRYDRNGNEEYSYALSLSDLCVGEEIEKLVQAGVTSFKIEGRMRRAEYVAAAVAYYRALLDGKREDLAQGLSDLKRTYNRGNYTRGLAFGQDKKLLSPLVQGHLGEKVGVVKVLNGNYFVDSAFVPTEKDAFKILREGKEVGGGFFAKRERRGFWISSKARLKNGDGVFITTDQRLNERLLAKSKRKVVRISLRFVEGACAIAEGEGVRIESKTPLQSATSAALTEADLRTCFLKTDALPFCIEFEKIEIEGSVFIPKSQLNAFRREFYERLVQACLGAKERTCTFRPLVRNKRSGRTGEQKTAVIASSFEGVSGKIDVAIYKPEDYRAPLPKSFVEGEFEKYIVYPAFCTNEDEKRIEEYFAECVDLGVYAENYGGLQFAKEHGKKLFAGTGLNLFNGVSIDRLVTDFSIDAYALSKELNAEELRGLCGENAYVLSCGDIKLMDLIYCPFGKTCAVCDRRSTYRLTDENNRVFPVRRYVAGKGECRFEVYNCARLIGKGVKEGNLLADLSVTKEQSRAVELLRDEEKQKKEYPTYTSGHFKRGVL